MSYQEESQELQEIKAIRLKHEKLIKEDGCIGISIVMKNKKSATTRVFITNVESIPETKEAVIETMVDMLVIRDSLKQEIRLIDENLERVGVLLGMSDILKEIMGDAVLDNLFKEAKAETIAKHANKNL